MSPLRLVDALDSAGEVESSNNLSGSISSNTYTIPFRAPAARTDRIDFNSPTQGGELADQATLNDPDESEVPGQLRPMGSVIGTLRRRSTSSSEWTDVDSRYSSGNESDAGNFNETTPHLSSIPWHDQSLGFTTCPAFPPNASASSDSFIGGSNTLCHGPSFMIFEEPLEAQLAAEASWRPQEWYHDNKENRPERMAPPRSAFQDGQDNVPLGISPGIYDQWIIYGPAYDGREVVEGEDDVEMGGV